MSDCNRCGGECYGPCYDFCACRHCWRGWTRIRFLTRLKWRLIHIWREGW